MTRKGEGTPRNEYISLVFSNFLLNFFQGARFFPESDCDRRLRRSLDTIEFALIELPNSASFMKLVPDKFGIGCNGCFGYSFANAGDDFPNTVVVVK